LAARTMGQTRLDEGLFPAAIAIRLAIDGDTRGREGATTRRTAETRGVVHGPAHLYDIALERLAALGTGHAAGRHERVAVVARRTGRGRGLALLLRCTDLLIGLVDLGGDEARELVVFGNEVEAVLQKKKKKKKKIKINKLNNQKGLPWRAFATRAAIQT